MLIIAKGIGWKRDPENSKGWVSVDPVDYVAEIEMLRAELKEAAAHISGTEDVESEHTIAALRRIGNALAGNQKQSATDLVRRFNSWTPELLQCSQGGGPFNNMHLDAKDAEIDMTTSSAKANRRADIVDRLQAEIDRLTAALTQIRGFAHVMMADNWADLRLHIERQCDVLEQMAEPT